MESPALKQMKLDDILPLVGEFGKFQVIFTIFLCFLQFPGLMLVFLPYFSQHSPPWKCVQNSTVCTLKGTLSSMDNGYQERCSMPRSEWQFTEVKEYSIVTEVKVSIVVYHSSMIKNTSKGPIIWRPKSRETIYNEPWNLQDESQVKTCRFRGGGGGGG